jgi:UDP-N-acetylglucosamine diphosphorylase / glucose-1-phosphate thymidylyltransferase / UDP-N-acetylgalactosamine diphosphorylase / glucosamine-1-phosphate N-acetyltransferase / galactosamine-1-phosphate N-acetyltransferase
VTSALAIFEDRHWRDLRPLTDVLPVPALAFGASNLVERWIAATRLPLAGLIGRDDALQAWDRAPAPAARLGPDDELLLVNAAALPGPWVERIRSAGGPLLGESDGRVACVRAPFAMLEPGFARGTDLESLARSLEIPSIPVDARILTYPWKLIEWNAEAIEEDLNALPAGIAGDVHPLAALLEPRRISIAAGARVDPLAVLDARGGPIRIDADAIVLSHTVVTGPCVVGPGTQLLGGFIGRSTFGPECRVAGEVEDCVWQGYGNKRHHGFLGHSVIGEWVNLGALTTTSDLKNNYGPVRVWIDGREIDSANPKVGALIGAHVKTGIGTLLPTGATVGVGSNVFAGGRFAPKQVPSFAWWDGERMDEHRWEPFLKTARIAASRRRRTLSRAEESLLGALHLASASERGGDGVSRSMSPATAAAGSRVRDRA